MTDAQPPPECGRLHPGDSLQIDGEGAHGPVDLVQVPIRFLSVIAFPDSQV
jgi:hypothetical protein